MGEDRATGRLCAIIILMQGRAVETFDAIGREWELEVSLHETFDEDGGEYIVDVNATVYAPEYGEEGFMLEFERLLSRWRLVKVWALLDDLEIEDDQAEIVAATAVALLEDHSQVLERKALAVSRRLELEEASTVVTLDGERLRRAQCAVAAVDYQGTQRETAEILLPGFTGTAEQLRGLVDGSA